MSEPSRGAEESSTHDRRVHKVFVTRNTEYHLRSGVCVAVRDRQSGEWLRGHLALTQKVHGGIRFSRAGGIQANVGTPDIGESLFFHASGRDLVTSPVLKVERPERGVVTTYPRAHG